MDEAWLGIAMREAAFIAEEQVFMGTIRRSDSDDFRQELLLTLLRLQDRYDPNKGKPVTFIHTLLRRRARVLARSAARQPRFEDLYEEAVADPASEAELLLRELTISLDRGPRPQRVLFQFCGVTTNSELIRLSRTTNHTFYTHFNALLEVVHHHILEKSPHRY